MVTRCDMSPGRHAETQRTDTSCSLGERAHTHTFKAREYTQASQMAGDGWLFLQNSWRGMEGVGVGVDSWERLFLCATHWYHYINSLIAMPTLNWISLVS